VYGTRLPVIAGPKACDLEKPMPPRHRFLEPIHNVKERKANAFRSARGEPRDLWSSYLEKVSCLPSAAPSVAAKPRLMALLGRAGRLAAGAIQLR